MGDLKIWDDYNIVWVKVIEGDIDYINLFIEVYFDLMGLKGSYEIIVEIDDFEVFVCMVVVVENVQWFEDNSFVMLEYCKFIVMGISYKVVMVVGEVGDVSFFIFIGVNLLNVNWIWVKYGLKLVSFGNISVGYVVVDGLGLMEEFVYDDEEKVCVQEYGQFVGKMIIVLYEVLGYVFG